jgi:hypothetical protein
MLPASSKHPLPYQEEKVSIDVDQLIVPLERQLQSNTQSLEAAKADSNTQPLGLTPQ